MTLHDHTHNVHAITAVLLPLHTCAVRVALCSAKWRRGALTLHTPTGQGIDSRNKLGSQSCVKCTRSHLVTDSTSSELRVKREETLVYDASDSFSHLV